MTMLDKVSDAICCPQGCQAIAGGHQCASEQFREKAKAAIEAMREPTEEMIELFNDHDWIDRYWEPAIDAALKE